MRLKSLLLVFVLFPTIVFAMDTGTLNVKGDLTVDGAIYGDGSNLTGIEAGSVDLSAVDQDIDFDPANTYDITDVKTITATSMTISGTAERWAGNTYPANYIDFNDSATAVTVSTELNITGVTGSGKAVCVKADGNLGVCSDAVGAGGTCTCS
jgi:hypothetical protein